MHNVYIKAWKDPKQNWTKLPFIVIDDAIFVVLDSWPPEWCAPNLLLHDETAIQKHKDATKLLAQQKHNKQFTKEVRASHEVVKAAAEQTNAVEKAAAALAIGATTTQKERGPDLTIG